MNANIYIAFGHFFGGLIIYFLGFIFIVSLFIYLIIKAMKYFIDRPKAKMSAPQPLTTTASLPTKKREINWIKVLIIFILIMVGLIMINARVSSCEEPSWVTCFIP